MSKSASSQKDFELLKDAVRKAGNIALEYFGRKNLDSWLKRGVEPVTEVDLEIDGYLKKTLLGARFGYGWLSEETTDTGERLDKDKIWLVDPIDGTRAFIRGHTDFSITAALVEKGRPVCAVIFAPARDEFYAARFGTAATLNGTPIFVSSATVLEGVRMQGDRDYLKSKKWTKPWPSMTIGKYQSFALRLAAVAAGKYDAAVSTKPKSEWDVAAGDLILHEAGGRCIDGDGKPFSYNRETTKIPRIIACGPGLEKKILTQLKMRKA